MTASPNITAEPRPKIQTIELTPLFVPFREEVVEAMKAGEGGLGMAIAAGDPWVGGDFVICTLTADDGNRGLGEVFVWLPETGVSPAQIIDAVQRVLGRYVLGESPFDIHRIAQKMDENLARNEVAKGLLDMACYDLMGRIENRRVCDLIGKTSISEIPLAALIPLMDVKTMVELAGMFARDGYRTFRCKTGRSPAHDIEIMESMRGELGNGVRLRVDYNQAYSPQQAVAAIQAIEPFGIDFAEQPVAAEDWLGMAHVQQHVDIPVMAHEGCFSMKDIRVLHALGAIGIVGINTERPGGVTRALEAIDFSLRKGLDIVLHNQTLGIAAAVHLHLAAVMAETASHAPELFGNVMYAEDIIREPIDYSGGIARVPHGPGWGVELDESARDAFAVGPTVRIDL
jgi:muconate cycloisomerase